MGNGMGNEAKQVKKTRSIRELREDSVGLDRLLIAKAHQRRKKKRADTIKSRLNHFDQIKAEKLKEEVLLA